ncbi:unnamed protein product [Microthlaspi erraticum]|uniref:Uncharacterized protein n=1 Tax=Microthlaspi erraticum TaxID=1685480 RepID=A0A6D2J813_9BRAS|nr:unnamed protein product [Microthlaspi erraticum]
MSKKKETKLSKYMKAPIKMVTKARDLYIRSMNQLSSHDLGGMSFGLPTACHVSALPRSFSASHTHTQSSARDKEHRLAELVRTASARNRTVDTGLGPLKLRKANTVRSCDGHDHHGFERIDEASPLISFESNHKMLQKSKSIGVAKYTYALQ